MELEKEKLMERLPILAEIFKEKNTELDVLISRMVDVRKLMAKIKVLINTVHESEARNADELNELETELLVLLTDLMEIDDLYMSFEGSNIIKKSFERNELLDWEKAAQHLYAVKTAYEDIGAAGSIALHHVIMPLVNFYEKGIRNKALYDEIFELAF